MKTKTVAASGKRQTKYTHLNCDTEMEMSEETADQFYSNPGENASLYCSTCNAGIRIGEDGEMVWTGTKDKVQG